MRIGNNYEQRKDIERQRGLLAGRFRWSRRRKRNALWIDDRDYEEFLWFKEMICSDCLQCGRSVAFCKVIPERRAYCIYDVTLIQLILDEAFSTTSLA